MRVHYPTFAQICAPDLHSEKVDASCRNSVPDCRFELADFIKNYMVYNGHWLDFQTRCFYFSCISCFCLRLLWSEQLETLVVCDPQLFGVWCLAFKQNLIINAMHCIPAFCSFWAQNPSKPVVSTFFVFQVNGSSIFMFFLPAGQTTTHSFADVKYLDQYHSVNSFRPEENCPLTWLLPKKNSLHFCHHMEFVFFSTVAF